ncbi:M20/M25/M40 family metallo-hydrolase [Bacteroidota bacterium]
MKSFILKYIKENQEKWVCSPEIFIGSQFQDCILLVFGIPEIAVFAHMDTTGFTVRYENQLVPIGSPEVKEGSIVVGRDAYGSIECNIKLDNENHVLYDFGRSIKRGTELVFKPNFRNRKNDIQSPYLDNRVGIFGALKVAETLENGILIFSCWEEHGGGSVPFLIKHIYENYHITKALISDVTWVTDGIVPGKGAVISLRDRNIPRKSFTDKIVDIARVSRIEFQLEVEGSGSSDGREIQLSPYPVDWCFIGPPEENVHSPDEKIHKKDILSTIELYKVLMKKL